MGGRPFIWERNYKEGEHKRLLKVAGGSRVGRGKNAIEIGEERNERKTYSLDLLKGIVTHERKERGVLYVEFAKREANLKNMSKVTTWPANDESRLNARLKLQDIGRKRRLSGEPDENRARRVAKTVA